MNRLSCVGISPYMDNREDARVDASNAAMEEMVNSIGLKLEDPAFQQQVRPIYDDSRARALSELEGVRGKAGGKEYQKALESVRASRKAVAEALVATGGAAAPTQQAAWYWEEYPKRDRNRHRVPGVRPLRHQPGGAQVADDRLQRSGSTCSAARW